jgi:hypothetical protein
MNLFRAPKLTYVDIAPEELRVEPPVPLPPLEHFTVSTRNVISKLDDQCIALRAEIDARQDRLAQLERVRAGMELALNHMED